LTYISQFGADLVVNYNEQKWEDMAELKGLDAVLDCVGEKDAFARMRANGVVKADGAFVTITSPDAGFNPLGHPPMHFASIYTLSNSAAVQDELASMIAAGKLSVSVNEEFPFTQEGVQALIRKVDSGASTGKNILRIA
jgi:NADPH:quinone reductase-like Zn-dependent oxidoreductase